MGVTGGIERPLLYVKGFKNFCRFLRGGFRGSAAFHWSTPGYRCTIRDPLVVLDSQKS